MIRFLHVEKLPSWLNGKGVSKLGWKQIKLSLFRSILKELTNWVMLHALFYNCTLQN